MCSVWGGGSCGDEECRDLCEGEGEKSEVDDLVTSCSWTEFCFTFVDVECCAVGDEEDSDDVDEGPEEAYVGFSRAEGEEEDEGHPDEGWDDEGMHEWTPGGTM